MPRDNAGPTAAYGRGVLLLVLGGTCLSLGGLFIRVIEEAEGWQILQMRSVGFCVTLLAFMAIRYRGRIVVPFRRIGWTGVACSLFLAIGFVTYVFALVLTTVANAMFVVAASPFFCAIGGLMFLGERVDRVTWAAIGLAFGGIAVMVSDSLRVGDWLGMVVALGVPTAFAGMVVSIRRAGDAADMMPAVFFSGVLAGLAALLFGAPLDGLPTSDLLLAMLMGSVQLGFGFILIALGTRLVPAAEVALLTLTEPILAPIWVWLAVGEVPTEATLIGGSAVLLAVLVQAGMGLRREKQA